MPAVMSDFTKKTKWRELKARERVKTKENLFNYIELLEAQVMELHKRVKRLEYEVRKLNDVVRCLLPDSNLDKNLKMTDSGITLYVEPEKPENKAFSGYLEAIENYCGKTQEKECSGI